MKRPFSMTAFGRGETQVETTLWTVEVRSVNHRFRDTKVRMPRRDLMEIEERIKKEIASHFSRGHIEVVVSCKGEKNDIHVQPNLELAREYHNSLLAICDELSLVGKPTLAEVISARDIISEVTLETDIEETWPPIAKALKKALKQCDKMRLKEGKAMKKELTRLLASLEKHAAKVEKAIPEIVANRRSSLMVRLDSLLNGIDIDPARLAQEAAILSDKADVTEELARLKSHFVQFSDYLELDEPVGRRLDFLLQEFHREINTLSSKINNLTIAHQSVEMKNDTEKLREQVQNIE